MRSSLRRGRRRPFPGIQPFIEQISSFGFFALFQTGFPGGAPPDFAAFGAAIASTHKIFLLYVYCSIEAPLITRPKIAAKSNLLDNRHPFPIGTRSLVTLLGPDPGQ
jgi:hypothetical protein